MTRLEYILLIVSKSLEHGTMKKKVAARILDRCLTVAYTAPEPGEENTDFSQLHSYVSRNYGDVMYNKESP